MVKLFPRQKCKTTLINFRWSFQHQQENVCTPVIVFDSKFSTTFIVICSLLMEILVDIYYLLCFQTEPSFIQVATRAKVTEVLFQNQRKDNKFKDQNRVYINKRNLYLHRLIQGEVLLCALYMNKKKILKSIYQSEKFLSNNSEYLIYLTGCFMKN